MLSDDIKSNDIQSYEHLLTIITDLLEENNRLHKSLNNQQERIDSWKAVALKCADCNTSLVETNKTMLEVRMGYKFE